MILDFEGQSPIRLAQNKKLCYSGDDLLQIENIAGVYYFARHFGDKFWPFYIGETKTLLSRLKSHLDTRRIADILRGMPVPGAQPISSGSRWFHYAYFKARKKQDAKKCCQVAQKFMIQEALAEELPLLNSKLTVIRTHSLVFSGADLRGGIFREQNTIAL